MGFWIFMLIMNLLMPLIMIVFGYVFLKGAPKTISHLYGYRTTMSMKNRDTWEFAHSHCGKLWRRIGWVLLVISVAVMLAVMGKAAEIVGLVGCALCVVQVIVIIASIFPTERALKKTFYPDGSRR